MGMERAGAGCTITTTAAGASRSTGSISPAIPVREILEVKIDGAVVPELHNWRLDKRRFLTRMADANGNAQRWPSCQRLDEHDTEIGTFSVTYAYGQDAPLLGQLAAAQVGCEIYRARNGDDCALPSGTVRVTRQGVTIDKMATLGWYRRARRGTGRRPSWATGLALVDAFLNGIEPLRSHAPADDDGSRPAQEPLRAVRGPVDAADIPGTS